MLNWAFAILFPLCCLLMSTVLALIIPLEEKSQNNTETIQDAVLLETLLKCSPNVPRVVDAVEL